MQMFRLSEHCFISHACAWRRKTSHGIHALISKTCNPRAAAAESKAQRGTVKGCASANYFIQQHLIVHRHINAPLGPIKPYRTAPRQHATLKRWWCVAAPMVSVSSDNSVVSLTVSSLPGCVMSDLLTARLYYAHCDVTREAAHAHLNSKTKTYRLEQQKHLLTQINLLAAFRELLLLSVSWCYTSDIYILYYILGVTACRLTFEGHDSSEASSTQMSRCDF